MVACDNQERPASEKKRKIFTDTQKAKVALEAVKGTKTVNEIAQKFGVHIRPKSINRKKIYWKMRVACSKARGPKPVDAHGDPDRLYAKIGRLNMELD